MSQRVEDDIEVNCVAGGGEAVAKYSRFSPSRTSTARISSSGLKDSRRQEALGCARFLLWMAVGREAFRSGRFGIRGAPFGVRSAGWPGRIAAIRLCVTPGPTRQPRVMVRPATLRHGFAGVSAPARFTAQDPGCFPGPNVFIVASHGSAASPSAQRPAKPLRGADQEWLTFVRYSIRRHVSHEAS
jgi:hypothetical protein